MSDKDGLFENPNQNEEQNIEEQKRDTLLEIKDDTSSIFDVLNNFGGRQIELLSQSEKQAKTRHLSDKRANDALVHALKTLKTADKVRSENKAKSPQLPAEEKASHSKPSEQNKRRNKSKKNIDDATISDEDLHNQLIEKKKYRKNAIRKRPFKKPMAATDKERDDLFSRDELPNNWQRDKSGRVRNQKGHYVKEDELAKYSIKNPQKNEKDSAEETEDLARDSALLDALKDVKDAVESPDNLDPLIDSVKEVTAPLSATFDISKTVVGTAGRGFSKLFGSQNKEQRWRNRLFNFFKKFAKNQEKSANQQTSWLKRIWKKPNGESLLGRLFGGLMGLASIPSMLARLPFMLATSLGRVLIKGIVGTSKLGVGALGSIGKLGKGFIKKIPILGALFALSDGIGGLFDNTRDENGLSNRGKRVGSGIGTAIGALSGSVFGPVGTIAGAMIGDLIGEKIGAWVADFDWEAIGQKISNVWDNTKSWIISSWNSIDWGDFGQKISNVWDNTKSWITSSWNSIDWGDFGQKISNVWDNTKSWAYSKLESAKNVAINIKNDGVGLANKAIDGTKNAVTSTKNWVTDQAKLASDIVGNWFNNNDIGVKDTLDNIEEAEKTQITNDAGRYSILEKIKNILADTLLLWRDWVANIYTHEMSGENSTISNGHPSTLSTQDSFNDTSGVPMISGGAVDPKTGKPLRYTNAEFKGGNIDGLSAEETALAMNALSARESSSNFQAENQFGYIGGYQFGGEALADLGYVNKQKWQLFRAATKGKNIYSGGKGNSLHAQFLNDPSNWNIQGGKQTYLNSKALQDESAVKLMNKNIQLLKEKDVQLNNAGDIVGAGFASHLKGVGNALKLFKNGIDSRDANGTSTSYYAQLGKNAMTDQKAASTIAAQVTTPTQGISIPQTENIIGMYIPAITPPKDITHEIIQRMEQQETTKKSTALQPTTPSVVKPTNTQDYGLQFLTQDVSDRRIAHIVTGGIAQKGRV